ncbi:ribonuclease III [Latilactobacillus fuchuensis]|jgi:ribonuclease-3|uniref:Ribonuclease 3 n=2 Tax=Latilactobacillus fuchuensis TaxID=164393 RepID=A0A2N9DUR2_9LACO|nr:ribonuclease III [Latilactobacillus fuchuensis]KRL61478.1 rnc protein [Latilactobacillus fuchuensis DSM 14340 = JCM 11249]SPC37923.1 ribonuclease III [Latilactobacillus fuchuensis]
MGYFILDAALVSELRARYGIEFQNLAILDEAFTHSSYVNEHRELGLRDNERLEFLGDAVMEITVSEYLFQKYPDWPEGKLTRLRAAIVCTKSFSSFSKEAHFDRYIRLGKGEEKNGARARATLLEDLFEAFNGALFLDQGRGAVVKFVEQLVFPKIEAGEFSDQTDYKTNLQEFLQQDGEIEIDYQLLAEVGPSHDRQFEVDVIVDHKVLGSGVGRNKKAAEQAAAKKALSQLK